MGNGSIIEFRTREQLRKYLRIFSPRFSKPKLEALANHVAKVSRKMYEAPEFFYYAIADGLRWIFVCHGRWRGLDCVREKHGDLQIYRWSSSFCPDDGM